MAWIESTTEFEAMQQVIHRLTAQGHAEFRLQDAPQVPAPEGADAVLGLRPGLQALLEPEHVAEPSLDHNTIATYADVFNAPSNHSRDQLPA